MNKGGKQYGLIMPKKIPLSTPKAGNIFGDDHDSDTEDGLDWVKKSLKAESEKNRMKKQTKLDMQRALNEDPTIYQYDEIYDEMEKKEVQNKADEKKEIPKPKYIHNLLKAADRRKREQEHRIERMVQKEREAEGEIFADKESFVTSAYKAKLEEFKKLEEEEERMDRLEAIGDVTKQQDMSGFYRQLFAQTVDAPKENVSNEDLDTETITRSSNIDGDDNISSGSGSNSETDADSDHEHEQQERQIDSQVLSKTKKSRQYRQRVVETSDVESDPEDNKGEESGKESPADNEKRVDDECESPTKKAKRSDKTEEKVVSNDMSSDPVSEVFKIPENKTPIKKENVDENVTVVEESKPQEKKVSIWEKRTVGPVFEAALQRYYNRKAMRMSGC